MSTRIEAELTFQDAVRTALRDAMTEDPAVVLWGEDIGVYGGAFGVTRGLLDEFGPDRVRDCPISEAAIAGMAVGAAMLGMKPVVEIMFMDFISLAVDALCNHAAKIHYMFNGQYSVPLVVRAPMGAGRGYGPSHSQSLAAWFAHIPGIKVVAPARVQDAYSLLLAAIADPNPVLFLEHKLLYSLKAANVPLSSADSLGVARVHREGNDLTVVTYAHGVLLAEQAAERLHQKGVETEILDLRTIRPLDIETVVRSCAKTGRVIVLSEEYPFCGIGSELCATIQERCWPALRAPVIRISGKDTSIPCALGMEEAWLPSVEDVLKRSRALGLPER